MSRWPHDINDTKGAELTNMHEQNCTGYPIPICARYRNFNIHPCPEHSRPQLKPCCVVKLSLLLKPLPLLIGSHRAVSCCPCLPCFHLLLLMGHVLQYKSGALGLIGQRFVLLNGVHELILEDLEPDLDPIRLAPESFGLRTVCCEGSGR